MPSRKEIKKAKERAFPVLHAWQAAFNAQDQEAWKATHHVPHHRLASGEMRSWGSEDVNEASAESLKNLLSGIGWHNSEWTRLKIIHCSDEKIHVDTQFTRYREDGSVIAAYDSLYILTYENGRWGVKMRSSFAG